MYLYWNILGTWYVALGIFGSTRVCINDESVLTLTLFTPRSNLIPNSSILKHSRNVHVSITVQVKIIVLVRNVRANESLVLYKHQNKGKADPWPFIQCHSLCV